MTPEVIKAAEIRQDRIISLNFVAKVEGKVIAQSGEKPFTFLHGYGQLKPLAFETEITGMKEGEHKEFTLPPEKAFGLRNPARIIPLSRRMIPPDMDVSPGSQAVITTASGHLHGIIVSATDDVVLVDTNHQWAGKPLEITVDVAAVDLPDPGFVLRGCKPLEPVKC